MRRSAVRLAWLALLPLLAAPAAAQIAQGARTRLLALSLDGAGGSAASLGIAAHVALGDLSGGQLASNHYRAVFGFLAGNDPHATTAPIVFGIQPDFGPVAGDTVVTLSGLNFDNHGQGGSIEVTVGGKPPGNLVVKSSNVILLLTPPGVSGPSDVVVTSSFGSSTREDGFLYTPAIVTTPVVPPGGLLELHNWGPPGDSYVTFVSLTPWAAPTRYGLLLVGPIYFQLMPSRKYPGPDGHSSMSIRLPADGALVGLTFHFQSLDISQRPPFGGVLTNASTVTVP